MLNQGLFTSKTDLRSTPQSFFDKLNEEFWFTLDPCSTDENAKCEKHFTIEDDWLKQSRDNEIVFCNPPYWKEIKKRVQKWAFARGWSLCSYLQGQTHLDFTISSITSLRSDLSEVAWNSETEKTLHLFPRWLLSLEIKNSEKCASAMKQILLRFSIR